MIVKGRYDYYGKECSHVTINLSDKKHKTRMLSILETKNATNTYKYDIQVAWTEPKYHPTMLLSEDELIELSSALNELANEIMERRNQ